MKARRVFYAEANYGKDEIDEVVNVLENQRHALVAGKKCSEIGMSAGTPCPAATYSTGGAIVCQ